MVDTERLAVLQQVRKARNAVEEDRQESDLSTADQSMLTKLSFDLADIEDLLILEDIEQKVGELNEAAAYLTSTVVDAMKAANTKISKELSLVDGAAKAVAGLVTLVTAAASHGLLS